MLATKGVRALLVGSGFVEEKDALNAESADVATVQAGLEGLQALQVTSTVKMPPPLQRATGLLGPALWASGESPRRLNAEGRLRRRSCARQFPIPMSLII